VSRVQAQALRVRFPAWIASVRSRYLPISFAVAQQLLPSAQDRVRKLPKEICAVCRINP
jgi:hypothetical protein